jgi:glycosyltransferase involved in cell wall biosynthesis
MFSGQFIERKMPLFFAEVARNLYCKTGRCKALIIGSGPREKEFIGRLEEYGIDYTYAGFVDQRDLPKYYSAARVFLFPTLSDPWGVVANEACSVGVPVITCNNAGVANDLIVHNYNGYILPLNTEMWSEYIISLINDNDLYQQLSFNAISKVQEYNYESASQGIIDAVLHAERGQ